MGEEIIFKIAFSNESAPVFLIIALILTIGGGTSFINSILRKEKTPGSSQGENPYMEDIISSEDMKNQDEIKSKQEKMGFIGCSGLILLIGLGLWGWMWINWFKDSFYQICRRDQCFVISYQLPPRDKVILVDDVKDIQFQRFAPEKAKRVYHKDKYDSLIILTLKNGEKYISGRFKGDVLSMTNKIRGEVGLPVLTEPE